MSTSGHSNDRLDPGQYLFHHKHFVYDSPLDPKGTDLQYLYRNHVRIRWIYNRRIFTHRNAPCGYSKAVCVFSGPSWRHYDAGNYDKGGAFSNLWECCRSDHKRTPDDSAGNKTDLCGRKASSIYLRIPDSLFL